MLPGFLLQANEYKPEHREAMDFGESENIRSDREEVSSVEDGSIAEAVERRPDLQFRNIKLDGEEAAISLDELSSEVVSSLEVLRAVTPEMDADARGGSLVVRSKPTCDLKKASTSISVNKAYRSILDNRQESIIFNHSRSLGSFGFRLNASVESGLWGTASYSADWYAGDSDSGQRLRRAAIGADLEDSAKYALGGNVDWKISQHFSVYLRGNCNLKDIALTRRPTLRYRIDPSQTSQTSAATGSVERDLVSFESEWKEDSFVLGGYLDYENTEVDFRFLANSRYIIEPDYLIIEFRLSDADLSHYIDDSAFPLFENYSFYTDPQAFRFDELATGTWEQTRKERIAALNVRHSIQFLGGEAVIKTGGKWVARDFDQLSDERFFDGYEGDFRLSNVSGDPLSEALIGDRYTMGTFPEDQRSRDYLAANYEAFLINERLSREASDPGTYVVAETIPATYAMMDWKKRRWRFLGGLRYEQTQLDFQAHEVIVDANGAYLQTNDVTGKSEYNNFFPGIHARYFMGSRTTIIASATRTIKRHFYGQIAPYRYVDYEDKTIRAGNPSLKPTLFSNIDAAIDYKLSEDSVLALDLYHREITDTIYSRETMLTEGLFNGFQQTSLSNGPSATLSGIKLTWKQSLGQWNDSLEGLSFNLNGSFNDSETEYPQRPDEQMQMANSPKMIIQALLTLNRNRFFFQLSYSYAEATLTSVSGVPWRDRFSDSSNQLDMRFSLQLSNKWRLIGEINNLLDQNNYQHFSDPQQLVQVEQDPRWFKIGLRWEK